VKTANIGRLTQINDTIFPAINQTLNGSLEQDDQPEISPKLRPDYYATFS
jgi:hypothetical protein